jgi:predicted enzyme related to lactoylglutathione lyase
VSERDGYQPGVPAWVDNLARDPRRQTDFYGALFGWEFTGPGAMPGDPPGEYFVAQLRGREVAGIGSLPEGGELEPAWNTYIEVESVERAARDVEAAGGTVLDGPFDIAPAGRIAVVTDRAGAPFCIWQPDARRGAELVNEPSAWSMSALNTPDPDEAAEFYRAVFGWETEPFQLGEFDATMFRLPGYVGGNPGQPVPRDVIAAMLPLAGENGDGPKPHWSVDFWVGDIDATAGKAAELGGSVVVPPYEIPGFRQAVLMDPEGAAFSATQLMIAGPA